MVAVRNDEMCRIAVNLAQVVWSFGRSIVSFPTPNLYGKSCADYLSCLREYLYVMNMFVVLQTFVERDFMLNIRVKCWL